LGLLSTWVDAGQSPDTFWRRTLREIRAVLEGVGNRMRREHDERMSLAWHVAALTRATKMPKLRELMIGPQREARPQTMDEQKAAIDGWLAVLSR
jgi:hypothetical protein